MFTIEGKYADAKVFTNNIDQSAMSQLYKMLSVVAFEGSKIRIMPDVHKGEGCVIGFTATLTDKVISNTIGVDVNCGMYTVKLGKVDIDLPALDKFIKENIPHGVEINQAVDSNVDKQLIKDVRAVCRRINKEIGRYVESFQVNEDYMINSIGSLGSGNHFVEVDKDKEGNLYLVIHSGSRNFGKQVAEFHQLRADEAFEAKRYRIQEEIIEKLKSENRHREIQAAIEKHKAEYKCPKDLRYLEGAMFDAYVRDAKVAQRYADENRCIMAKRIVGFLGYRLEDLEVFQTRHNYIDFDAGVIRKGAISAQKGEKVLIPLNMEDGSILAVGKGNPDWNYSAPHGAGRLMSRGEAKRTLDLDEYKLRMAEKGIYTTSVSVTTLDEAPMAYKPSEEIIEAVEDTVDIIDIIKPVYNFKDRTMSFMQKEAIEKLKEIVEHNEKQLAKVDGDQGRTENLYEFEFKDRVVYDPFHSENMMEDVDPIEYYGKELLREMIGEYVGEKVIILRY